MEELLIDLPEKNNRYKVVQIDDRVEVYRNNKKIGGCESYELDYICRLLGVEYEEEEM